MEASVGLHPIRTFRGEEEEDDDDDNNIIIIINIINLFTTSQRTQSVSITKTSHVVLFGK
jgi:hypothetical protein